MVGYGPATARGLIEPPFSAEVLCTLELNSLQLESESIVDRNLRDGKGGRLCSGPSG
ncbi:MAG: hypothetical protein R3E01_16165 [Pirellulaceae bacterium]|nr:hypothetical protein [Planctomycetales bacterium]